MAQSPGHTVAWRHGHKATLPHNHLVISPPCDTVTTHTQTRGDRVILCARDTATQSQRHRITKWPNHPATPWRGGTATKRRCRTITS